MRHGLNDVCSACLWARKVLIYCVFSYIIYLLYFSEFDDALHVHFSVIGAS